MAGPVVNKHKRATGRRVGHYLRKARTKKEVVVDDLCFRSLDEVWNFSGQFVLVLIIYPVEGGQGHNACGGLWRRKESGMRLGSW